MPQGRATIASGAIPGATVGVPKSPVPTVAHPICIMIAASRIAAKSNIK
ncbi:MAG: hypothetical protein ACI3YH_08880 [Eubacteriales bacterium]